MTNEEIIDLFEQLAEDFCHEGFEVRSYSGRCMYGRRCLAVVVPDVLAALQGIFEGLADRLDDLDQVRDLCESLGNPSSDQMGRSDGVLYWPSVEWPEGRADCDEEDEDEAAA